MNHLSVGVQSVSSHIQQLNNDVAGGGARGGGGGGGGASQLTQSVKVSVH